MIFRKPFTRPNAPKKPHGEIHTHTWQKFKQTVRADNPNYKGPDVTLEVIACTECKEKHYTDYVKEKT